jgi:hypothetical protein
MQTQRSNGCERKCKTFINLPVGYTKVSGMQWKGMPRAFVGFSLDPHSQALMPFRPPAPLLPDILGATIREHTTISDVHTPSTTIPPPPPPPDADSSSSSQQTSQQLNHLATFAMKTRNSSQNGITIPKGRVPPGPLSAPAAVSTPQTHCPHHSLTMVIFHSTNIKPIVCQSEPPLFLPKPMGFILMDTS